MAKDDKWVYDFAEGSKDMRDLLGGKGANVAEMTRVLGAERVPAGFTITTEACVAYMKADQQEPDGMADEVAEALDRLQEHTGKQLGDDEDPLLVSVRSGARESMPGMLDTVLNLGMNDKSVEGLAKATENERFAWDSYRRFLQMFGNVVAGIDGEAFEQAIAEVKEDRGVEEDTDLDTDALKELVDRFKALYKEHTDEDFPQDPQEQLRLAIRAVFDSWTGDRAHEYRRINRIPDDWGTAVNVQQMVFGNKGDTSGSGVAFSRDEVTGAPEPSGDFLPNAQGEDVVSGARTPRDISEMKEWLPDAYEQLMEILRTLEKHYEDMQDTEFTVEDGQLYMLQTRDAKRPAQAAVRFARDAVEEGLLDREQALMTVDADMLVALLVPTFDPKADYEVHRHGRRRRARRRQGRGRLHGQGGGRRRRRRPRGRARPPRHERQRRRRLPRRQGHPHEPRRQGQPRRARRPRHGRAVRDRGQRAARRPRGPRASASATRSSRPATSSPSTAPTARSRSTTSRSSTPTTTPPSTRCSRPSRPCSAGRTTSAAWACARTRTPRTTPKKARELGAEGIGLCRTEHMFMAEDRQPKMRTMIMADDTDSRRDALAELLPLQQEDFEGLFEAMKGLPVTIRLLDPPLHEFLPDLPELAAQVERARIECTDDLEELEKLLEITARISEENPMLGTRGCRLGILYPEIYEMQVKAIMRAAKAMDEPPHPEIMIPLVDYEHEIEIMRELVVRIGEEEGLHEVEDYTVGTMIELPRACFVADRIARHADFFSFGTNDLTQTALGFSRDDVESKFVPAYMERKIIDRSPFETIDKPGRRLARAARRVGRARGAAGPQARDLRRARGRPGLDRVLPHGRARLRVVLAVPRPDRAGRGGPGGDHPRQRSLLGGRVGKDFVPTLRSRPMPSAEPVRMEA